MTERNRMLSGQMYSPFDRDLTLLRKAAKILTRKFNSSTESQEELRNILLSELFGASGDNIYIEPPFRADYGLNIYIGDNFYANYDCIILDVCKVEIGNDVYFGPRVCLYTASHPIDATARNTQLEFGKPIKIGNNVWIGGNSVINPGVSIGDNVVIGAGSIVTKDVPTGVVAAGNPARVLREISEADTTNEKNLVSEYLRKIKAPSET